MAWLNLFKNDKKVEGDNQPLYKNVKVVFEEDVTLTAGTPYEVALWKKDQTNSGKPTDMVSIKIEPNNYLINNSEVAEVKEDNPPF